MKYNSNKSTPKLTPKSNKSISSNISNTPKLTPKLNTSNTSRLTPKSNKSISSKLTPKSNTPNTPNKNEKIVKCNCYERRYDYSYPYIPELQSNFSRDDLAISRCVSGTKDGINIIFSYDNG